jgi:hypothetical protein
MTAVAEIDVKRACVSHSRMRMCVAKRGALFLPSLGKLSELSERIIFQD